MKDISTGYQTIPLRVDLQKILGNFPVSGKVRKGTLVELSKLFIYKPPKINKKILQKSKLGKKDKDALAELCDLVKKSKKSAPKISAKQEKLGCERLCKLAEYIFEGGTYTIEKPQPQYSNFILYFKPPGSHANHEKMPRFDGFTLDVILTDKQLVRGNPKELCGGKLVLFDRVNRLSKGYKKLLVSPTDSNLIYSMYQDMVIWAAPALFPEKKQPVQWGNDINLRTAKSYVNKWLHLRPNYKNKK